MTPTKPRLSRRAAEAIRELRTDHGVEPTLDEILWLHELGLKIEDPLHGDRIDAGGTPARAGNVWLWPFTVMASAWYHDQALVWWERRQPLLCTYALAFALAHGRGEPTPSLLRRGWGERIFSRLLGIAPEPVLLCDLREEHVARAAVRAWMRGLTCTRSELETAIDAVVPHTMGPQPSADRPAHGVDWSEVIHDLVILTGTDPDYWRMRVSTDSALAAYSRAVAIERARRGQGSAAKDALAMAIQEERAAIVAIIAAHKEPQT